MGDQPWVEERFMFCVLSLRAVLPLTIVLFQAAPSVAQDATALLNEVSQRYADAKSYHIEAVEERSSSSELNRDWQKTFMTAVVSPGRTLPVRRTIVYRTRDSPLRWYARVGVSS
jgi:hypothetical protein